MLRYFILLCFFVCVKPLYSQQLSYTDPAEAYNRILLEKGQSTYERVGSYKVIGNPYLYSPRLKGNVYTTKEQGLDYFISFNTYYQRLEIYQAKDQELPLIKGIDEVDSFRLIGGIEPEFKEDLVFFNSVQLDSSRKKFFLQAVYNGEKYSLYKCYRSDLAIVNTNYVDADLRQFDLQYEYYYTSPAKDGLHKIKLTRNAVKKEFKNFPQVASLVDSETFGIDTENTLKQVFGMINLK